MGKGKEKKEMEKKIPVERKEKKEMEKKIPVERKEKKEMEKKIPVERKEKKEMAKKIPVERREKKEKEKKIPVKGKEKKEKKKKIPVKRKEKKEKEKKIPVIDLCSPISVEQKQMPSQSVSRGTKRRATLDNSDLHSTHFSPICSLSSRRGIQNHSKTNQKKKLDTRHFQLYLEKMWEEIPEDKKKSHAYLDCLWFHLYNKKGSDKTKVLKWIGRKKIFSWNYVFVPIVCWDHWSLLILCHLSEDLKTGEPCMLLLDSLGATNAELLEPHIRKFLCDIFKEAGGLVEMEQVQKIPLLVPKVMKQRGSDECGNFVLYFMHLFLQDDLENFRVSEMDKYFMKEVWHDYKQQKTFSDKIASIESLACD